MTFIGVIRFILAHPINRGRSMVALLRFAEWLVRSRLQKEVIFDWIGGAKLVDRRGMTGATGNVYCGLHEYADMAFVLHLLRENDLFLDIGANIGSYTVLASKVCGARSISLEPDPGTVVRLTRNIEANGIGGRVEVVETALGATSGTACFSIGLDTVNKVVDLTEENSREVRLSTLDVIVGDQNPTMIKMDVEGFEAEVLKGAKETLRKKSLLAIETETSDSEVIASLIQAGFEPVYYDPALRKVSREPLRLSASNALYVRDCSHVQRRVSEAPVRTIIGKAI